MENESFFIEYYDRLPRREKLQKELIPSEISEWRIYMLKGWNSANLQVVFLNGTYFEQPIGLVINITNTRKFLKKNCKEKEVSYKTKYFKNESNDVQRDGD